MLLPWEKKRKRKSIETNENNKLQARKYGGYAE